MIKRTTNRGLLDTDVSQVVDHTKHKVVTDDSVISMTQKTKRSDSGPSPPVEGVVVQKLPGPEDIGVMVKIGGKRGLDTPMLATGAVDTVASDTEDHRDRRRKTIRKHFSEAEQLAYDQMYTDLLRKHVKLCTFDDIQTALSNVVLSERFTHEQRQSLASSTYSNLAVQYSRIRKTQIKMLQSDIGATRWLDEVFQNQNPLMDPATKQKELDDRLHEAAKYLAARTISKTSAYFRPTDEELERARKLLKKWMNPQKRAELLMSLQKPRRGSELASSK